MLTDAQIKHMVDRFLGWQLPRDFKPDGEGMTYKRPAYPMAYLTGTNLLTADQAEAMIRYMAEGL